MEEERAIYYLHCKAVSLLVGVNTYLKENAECPTLGVGQSNFSYQWVHLYLLHKLISFGSFPFPLLNSRTQAAPSSVDYLSGFEQHHVLYHNEIKTINCALFA